VDALNHHVVREDEGFAAHLQDRAIIGEPARRAVQGHVLQRGDEGGLTRQFSLP